MKNNHKPPKFVAFFDLVKAFDTAGHELLIKVLGIYGAPPKLFLDIHKVYQDLIISLKIENSKEEISKKWK